MADSTTPVSITINLRVDEKGQWMASVFGYESTKYFYAESLSEVLLKVAAHAANNKHK